MGRTVSVSLLALVLALGLAVPAVAESETVKGTGDVKKLFANNAKKAVVAKVFGIGQPCEVAKQLYIEIRWGKKQAYQVQSGCYGGTTWGKGLYFLSDRSDPNTAKKVKCADFKLTFNSDKVFHKAFVPRKCMGKAPNRVKLKTEGVNYAGSATGGQAGPTSLLDRG